MTDAIKKDDYARLHYAYHEDTDLAIIADQLEEECGTGWLVWLYWPRMIARAKQAKTFGWYSTTPRKLAASVHDPLTVEGAWAARARMWNLLRADDLIRVRQGAVVSPSSKIDVLIVEYEKWQSLSNAESSKLKRERQRHRDGEEVHWTVRHWSDFAFSTNGPGYLGDNELAALCSVTDADSSGRDNEAGSRDNETGSRDTPLDETRQDETTDSAGVRCAPDPLPPVVEQACIDAAVTGPRADWWRTSISRLRQRNASAPDDVFVGSIDWIVQELDGKQVTAKRAWEMLAGSVASRVRRANEAARSAAAPVARRSAADLLAEQDRIWGTPA